jgi:hypothetical protein
VYRKSWCSDPAVREQYAREADVIPFCPKTRAMASRRFAIVEVERPTESLLPADHPNFLYRARNCPDQPIVQPLMISLPVVMVHEFGHRTA